MSARLLRIGLALVASALVTTPAHAGPPGFGPVINVSSDGTDNRYPSQATWGSRVVVSWTTSIPFATRCSTAVSLFTRRVVTPVFQCT